MASSRLVEGGARSSGRRLEVHLGGPQRTKVIVLLAGVLALSSADTATVGASATQLRSALHIDNTDIGLLVAVNAAVAAVASIPFGFVADRFRRTYILSGAVFLWGCAMLWSATAPTFDRLLLARLALGLVTAAAGPVVASLIGDYFPSKERGRIYGYVLTGELLGAGFGFAVTGDIAALSWRLAFVILAIPTFVLARLLLRLPEPIRGGLAPLQPYLRPEDGAAVVAPDDVAPTDRTLLFPANPNPTLPAPPVRGVGSGASHTDATGRLNPMFPAPGYTESRIGSTSPPQPEPLPPVPPAEAAAVPTDAQRLAQERGVDADEVRAAQLANPVGLIATMRHLLAIRTNTVLIVASALGYFYLAGIETFAVEFTKQQYGINQAVANLLLLVLGAGAVVGVLVSGPVSDRLLQNGRLNSRIATTGVMATLTVVLFVPALLSRSATTALPYLTLAAFALAAQNPPIDAARLDIVPAALWGRAEGLRTALRTAAQSLAPLAFGGLSDLFGGHRSGLQWAFLLMLIPLAGNAFVLFRAMRTYPGDVATAAAAAAANSATPTRGRRGGRGGRASRGGRLAGTPSTRAPEAPPPSLWPEPTGDRPTAWPASTERRPGSGWRRPDEEPPER